MPREAYIPSLHSLFRQYGYDGATLTKIAQVTGLGKASLYHHFPGGKDDMATAVLDYTERWLQEHILSLLAGEGSPEERLAQMCQQINDLYAAGTQPCLLAILHSGTGRDLFHERVRVILEVWIEAIAAVLVEIGLDAHLARQSSEDTLLAIQGALMLSLTLDNPAIFQRTLQRLPQMVWHPQQH